MKLSNLVKNLLVVLMAYWSSAAACVAQQRDVELRVTILDPDGKPLAGVGVAAYTVGDRPCRATNATGNAIIPVKLPAAETRVSIELVSGCAGSDAKAMRQITTTMGVAYSYWINVLEDAKSAETTIRLNQAVKASGRVLDSTGLPAKGGVFVRGMRNSCPTDKEGRFVLPVRQSAGSEVWFVGRHTVVTTSFVVGDKNLGLGDIIVTDAQGNATVNVSLTDAQLLPPMAENHGGGIALISTDGKTLQAFAVKPPGLAVANYGTGELPKVPAGTYYVTPGLFGNTPSFKVLDRIRAGRQAELDKAGVPKITAVADKETSLTINLPEAEAAFDKLPDLTPAQPPSDAPRK